MLELFKTDEYEAWFRGLRDRRAAARIAIRIERLAEGNPGDVKPVGGGVSEMRIDHGPATVSTIRSAAGLCFSC